MPDGTLGIGMDRPQPGALAPREGPPENFDYLGPKGKRDKLPEPLKAKLRSLAQKAATRESYARRWEIRVARENRLFYRGIQDLLWDADNNSFQIGQNTGGPVVSDAAGQPSRRETFNIDLGYAKSFMAVFCQNDAPVRFEPEDPKDSMDITAAAEANKLKRIIDKFNDPRFLQMEIGRLLWTDGRVIAHTRYVTDGQRFGFDNEAYPDEQAGGTEPQAAPKGKPKGKEVVSIYGVLETKVPIASRDMHEWPYICISTEFDKTTVKAAYPSVESAISSGGANSADDALFARNARVGTAEGTQVLTQAGDYLAHLATLDRWWFRPSFFTELPPTDPDRKELMTLFPDGCHVVFCGQTYCESRNESMDDHIAVTHALPGDGQTRPALSAPLIPVQKSFNQLMNLTEETLVQCVPARWVDQDVVDIDAIQEQESSPGSYIPAERKTGEALGDAFFEETPAQFPPEMTAHLQNLQGPLAQFLTSQQPALFGEGSPDQKTKGGYQMMRDQAMGIMGLVWLPFKNFRSRYMLQAVQAAAKNREEGQDVSAIVPVPNKPGQQEPLSVAIEDLKGNLLCYPETDENFPESWSSKRATYLQLLTGAQTNPQLAEILLQPDNLAMAKNLIGLDDLVIPGAEARDKQLKEISEMLQTEPIPDVAQIQDLAGAVQAAQATGQPAPPIPPEPPTESSVPVDPIFDDHAAELAECKRWLNSPEGQKAKEQNPQGFQNVRLHALQHMKAIAMQQPPPMPAMPPQMPHKAAGPAGPPKPPVQPPPAAPQAPPPVM